MVGLSSPYLVETSVSGCGHLYTTSPVFQETAGSATENDFSRIKDVVTRCNAMVSERPKSSFGVKNLEQDLPRLLQSGSVEHHREVLDRASASAALAGTTGLAKLGLLASFYLGSLACNKAVLQLAVAGLRKELHSTVSHDSILFMNQQTQFIQAFSRYAKPHKKKLYVKSCRWLGYAPRRRRLRGQREGIGFRERGMEDKGKWV